MGHSKYRGRFAPSPTGHLHFGLARTALLGWLRARSLGGEFVLRIEDIDGPRVVRGAADELRRDLAWLGLDWDEGPDVGGPYGPYVQSERTALYETALETLRARGLVYPCSCSRKDIALASAPHGPAELGPIYPGTCRNGPQHPERANALRLRVHHAPPPFVDAVLGEVLPEALSDFVLKRADGLYSYQLAVVVDDAAMNISEALRGEDLKSSTHLQLALYEALGLRAPVFAHVPLVYGPDGQRLAKRHGALAIASYRERGFLPEQVIGALAHSAGLLTSSQSVSARELVSSFSLTALKNAANGIDLTLLNKG